MAAVSRILRPGPSQYAGPFFISTFGLVSRFRSSHHYAARSIANFGIEGHQHLIDLVWLWFRSPHFGLAAEMMRTSEPPHQAIIWQCDMCPSSYTQFFGSYPSSPIPDL